MKIFIFAMFLFFLWTSVSAGEAKFFIESEIEIDGEVVASPSLLVKEGQQASVNKDEVYSLKVKATKSGEAILLETKFDQGERSVSQSILLVPGREAKISTGPASLKFKVRPVPGDP